MGLDVDSTDTIYVKSVSSVYTVSPVTGLATFLVALGRPFHNVLAFNTADTAFTVERIGGNSDLYMIDLTTGADTFIGSTGLAMLAGLAFLPQSGLSKGLVSGPDEPDLLPPFAVPDFITFETLNTTCSAQATFEFELNGTSLGSVMSDTTFGCTCSAPTDTFVAPAGLIASAWDGNAANSLRFVKTGGDNATAWTRAVLDFGASSQTVCVFDQGGGNCDVTDLCVADFTFFDVDSSASFPEGGME